MNTENILSKSEMLSIRGGFLAELFIAYVILCVIYKDDVFE